MKILDEKQLEMLPWLLTETSLIKVLNNINILKTNKKQLQ